MTEKIFISYSRRELGFVDDLVNKLEEKYQVWLDYRALIPGVPWAEQIDKGLQEADTVLLVVSKAALGSEFVALEWRHFLETKKRVILVIFEAVDLPTELEKYEWVDFRGSYKAGLEELFSQLEQPIQEEHPVPESGFRMPWIVWFTIALSVAVAYIATKMTYWTVFIPLFLLPLPYFIFRRSFDFQRVQVALVALPVALTIADLVYRVPTPTIWQAIYFSIPYGLGALVLLALLRSPALQRWGKPESNIPKFANPQKLDITNPEKVTFFVDYANEDRVVAGELIEILKKYGHTQSTDIHAADTVLVIVSRFKSDTEASPSKQVIFPIMLQNNDNISKSLSKVQWIDFRPGVRGLDTIAQLLSNPAEMLKALRMRPVSALSVYPPMITAIYYYSIIISSINIGAVYDYIFKSGFIPILEPASAVEIVSEMVAATIALAAIAYFIVKGLLSRTGFFSKSITVGAGLIVQGAVMFGLRAIDNYIFTIIQDSGFVLEGGSGYTFTYYGNIVFYIGVLVLVAAYLLNRRDLKHWFPAK